MTQTEMVRKDSSMQADQLLLTRLAQDQAFRQNLETNPSETLGSLGLKIAASAIPEEVRLPSTAQLRLAARELEGESVKPVWVPFLV